MHEGPETSKTDRSYPLVVTTPGRRPGSSSRFGASSLLPSEHDCTSRYEVFTLDTFWNNKRITEMYTLSTHNGSLWCFRLTYETAEHIGGSLLRFWLYKRTFAIGTIFRVYGRQADPNCTLLYLLTSSAPDTISLAPIQYDISPDLRGTATDAWRRLQVPDTGVVVDLSLGRQTVLTASEPTAPLSAQAVHLFVSVNEEKGQWTLYRVEGDHYREFSSVQRHIPYNQRVFSAKLAELREAMQKNRNGGRSWMIFPIERFNM